MINLFNWDRPSLVAHPANKVIIGQDTELKSTDKVLLLVGSKLNILYEDA
jgi:hypothetical protein